MKCIVCKNGSTAPGTTTFAIDKGHSIVVVRDVPAAICTHCGEEYLDAATLKDIERIVAAAQKAGLDVAVQHFKAA